jgi:hypothetical protein
MVLFMPGAATAGVPAGKNEAITNNPATIVARRIRENKKRPVCFGF